MQSNLARPPSWHPPSGPNPPHFERSDRDNTQGINQLEPYDDVFQYPETPQEEASFPFHPKQWPPRQAPMYQGVQNYSLDPFVGTSLVEDPAMRPALACNGPPFSEDLANLNDPYAYNATAPSNIMDETSRTVNQVHRETIAFPVSPLPRPAAYNLTTEVSPNNGFRADPASLGPHSMPFLAAYQGDFRRNSAFSPPDSRGASYANTMNGLVHQIYSEDVHYTTPLVQPPAVLISSNYGESASNGTSPEFAQWLTSFDKNNPAKNGYSCTPEGYDEPNSPRGIGEGIQPSPETTLTSLSPTPSSEAPNPRSLTVQHYDVGLSLSTPSRGLQTQSGSRRVAPYPAMSQVEEEPQIKNSKKIIPIPIIEAEALFGPKVREYWGTSKKIPDSLLWETRSAVEGQRSIKKRSKCKICGSLCSGSAALYHARKHLNINPYPCEQKDCPDSFAQSSDQKNHMKKIHQKHSDRPSTPPTSSQDHLNNLYHG